jgi:hypothetical protein
MSRNAMTDGEVRSRMEAIERYNAYFSREVDEKGQPLTQHIVGPRQLWNIMTREWGVDPRKFGIAEPPPIEWPPKGGLTPTVPSPQSQW